MVKTISISLDDWVIEDILGEQKNRSSKIQELIIKGHIAGMRSKQQKLINKKELSGNTLGLLYNPASICNSFGVFA